MYTVYTQWRNTRDLVTQEKLERPTNELFPNATQTILESVKSPSDDEDVRDTDEDEEQG